MCQYLSIVGSNCFQRCRLCIDSVFLIHVQAVQPLAFVLDTYTWKLSFTHETKKKKQTETKDDIGVSPPSLPFSKPKFYFEKYCSFSNCSKTYDNSYQTVLGSSSSSTCIRKKPKPQFDSQSHLHSVKFSKACLVDSEWSK